MRQYDDFEWVAPAELRRLSLDNAPWCHYLETEVRFEAACLTWAVRPVLSGGAGEPPWGPLHVISATQPLPELPGSDDTTRLAVLDQILRSARIKFIRAIGSSFDGRHQEESRAVFGLSDEEARELGCRFGQVAVFGWSGPTWSLIRAPAPVSPTGPGSG